MGSNAFRIKLWGVRGSLPATGRNFQEFGGNTTCFEVRCGEHVLIFDAGSGALAAGLALKAEGYLNVTMFLTHCHYDHIIGLPFFVPMYLKGASLKLWSGHMAGTMTTREILNEIMRKPFFPVGPDVCSGSINTGEFSAGDVLSPFPGVTVRTGMLNHPGNAIGYRVEFGGKSLAIITDTEHVPGKPDPNVLALIDGVDLFLYDSNYLDEEMDRFRGFGHSTWQEAVRLAVAAKARRVGLVHHSLTREDAAVAEIERQAQAQFPGAFCGRDLQVIEL